MNEATGDDVSRDRDVPGPDVLPARWFHLVGGERQGPVALADMRELVLEGSLEPDSYVWADGMPDWLHVRDVPALVPPDALRVTLRAWPEDGAGD
jgi:hypothetical protein